MTNKRSGWMLAAGSAAVLPGLVILSIIGVIVLGGIADGMPKNAAVKELLSWLQTLPVLTGNAVAAVIVAMFVLWAFAYEPGPVAEKHWFYLTLTGDRHAKWMIVQHNIHRLLMLAMFLYFFLPQR